MSAVGASHTSCPCAWIPGSALQSTQRTQVSGPHGAAAKAAHTAHLPHCAQSTCACWRSTSSRLWTMCVLWTQSVRGAWALLALLVCSAKVHRATLASHSQARSLLVGGTARNSDGCGCGLVCGLCPGPPECGAQQPASGLKRHGGPTPHRAVRSQAGKLHVPHPHTIHALCPAFKARLSSVVEQGKNC